MRRGMLEPPAEALNEFTEERIKAIIISKE
jgi:hypothetical protein